MLIPMTTGHRYVFEARGHTQIFASIHLSLKKVFARYSAVCSDGTYDSMNSLGRVTEIWFKEQTPVWEEPHLLVTRFITTRKPSLRNTGPLVHCLVESCSVAPSSG